MVVFYGTRGHASVVCCASGHVAAFLLCSYLNVVFGRFLLYGYLKFAPWLGSWSVVVLVVFPEDYLLPTASLWLWIVTFNDVGVVWSPCQHTRPTSCVTSIRVTAPPPRAVRKTLFTLCLWFPGRLRARQRRTTFVQHRPTSVSTTSWSPRRSADSLGWLWIGWLNAES